MSKRKNTFTRFIEDIVDDTKDFVDDVLDRAKDLETDVKDAVKDVVDDDEDTKVSTSGSGVAELQAALAELTAKVNQLAELQAARLGQPGARPSPQATLTEHGRSSEGRSSDGWRRDRRVAEVLDEADVLHVAVAARNGPHVTPAVFDVDGGRLWFVTPRRSVK